MKIGSQRVELNAINILSSILLKTGYIIPIISKGDTTPSWDGELLLYREKFSDKKDDLRKIQIQVKGRSRNPKSYSKVKMKFDVEKRDIINYELNGGAIYFLVCMSDFDNYKVFYNALTPFDLRKILKENEQNIGDIRLTFKELPSDLDTVVNICINFFENSSKQHSIKSDYLLKSKELLKFDEYSFSLYSISKNKLDSLFHTPLYIYGKISGIPVAVEKIDDIDSVETSSVQNVHIGENLYQLKVSVEKHREKRLVIKAGPCFVFYEDSWSFKVKGTLWERIQALKMILDIKKYHIIHFENFPYTISDEYLPDTTIANVKKDLENLGIIQNTFKHYGVHQDVDLDQLTDDESRYSLGLLCYTYEHNGEISAKTPPIRFSILECCNINIALYNSPIPNRKIKITDAFDSTFATSQDNKQPIGSVDGQDVFGCSYFSLRQSHFESLSNIDYNSLFLGLTQIKPTIEPDAFFTQTLLRMIDAFDSTKNIRLLDACIRLSDWIRAYYTSHRSIINYYQCSYRKRALTEDEVLCLMEMREKESDDTQTKLAISILLGNVAECKLYLSKLSDDEVKTFKQYPIFKLYKQ